MDEEPRAECPECGGDDTFKTNDDPFTGDEEWYCRPCDRHFSNPLVTVRHIPAGTLAQHISLGA